MSVEASGTFRIGGDLEVHRLGFAAMRITGKGIWGPPPDHEAALAVLRRVRELGIDLVDTADSYGPYVSEDLIREALWRDGAYGAIRIATKAGLTRHGPDRWPACGRPEYLRQCCLMSLRRLGLETLDLWQLHRIDSKVPRDEQFGVIAEMRREGLIRHVGLSEVNVEEIEAARKFFPVVSVQNHYNLVRRKYEEVLDFCEREAIAFIPWYPLEAGSLTDEGGAVATVARRLDATPAQVALAWVLERSPVMLPIPGTSKVKHLEENVAAASLELTGEEFRTLDELGRKEAT